MFLLSPSTWTRTRFLVTFVISFAFVSFFMDEWINSGGNGSVRFYIIDSFYNVTKGKPVSEFDGSDDNEEDELPSGIFVNKGDMQDGPNIDGSLDFIKRFDNSSKYGFYQENDIDDLLKRVLKQPFCTHFSNQTLMKSSWHKIYSDTEPLKTNKEDYNRLYDLLAKCGPPLDERFLKARMTPELYDFEKYYMSKPALTDPDVASSEHTSIVQFLSDQSVFNIGDSFSFRVDMRNGRGDPVTSGGDEIRVWLQDDQKTTSAAAHVTDLGNGSYMATGLLPWEGKVNVKVSLAHSRDFIRGVIRLMLLLKSLTKQACLFKTPEADEVTQGSHASTLPFYAPEDVCNLTESNGSPWYCGKPSKKLLRCSNFAGTRELPWLFDWRLPVSAAEFTELDRANKDPVIRLIRNVKKFNSNLTLKLNSSIEFFVTPNTTKPFNIPSCQHLPSAKTWSRLEPSGIFKDNKWFFTSCHIDRPANCLSNISIYISGDSNSRAHYETFCSAVKGSKPLIKRTHGAWHAPLKCVHEKHNLSVDWSPHSDPFRSSYDSWSDHLVPSSQAIDAIPDKGRVLLVLHHYFHLVMHHISAFHGMVKASREAVERLLERNPEARVVIQGPHVVSKGLFFNMIKGKLVRLNMHYIGGDGLGRFFEDILFKEYEHLKDKVVYFRTWGLTTSLENMDVHSPKNHQFGQAILDLMCGRWDGS